jgi:hypothetical protein
MALDDIVFTTGEPIGFTVTISRGDIGTVSEIMTETNSSTGILLNEIPSVIADAELSYTFVN